MLWHGGQHFVIRSPNSLPSALLPQTLTTTQARSAGPLEVTNSDPFTSSHLPRLHTCFLTPSLCSLAFFITIPSLPLIQDSFLDPQPSPLQADPEALPRLSTAPGARATTASTRLLHVRAFLPARRGLATRRGP